MPVPGMVGVLKTESVSQRYAEVVELIYFDGSVNEDANLVLESKRLSRLARYCFKYTTTRSTTDHTCRSRPRLEREGETPLYGCVTWALRNKDYIKLHATHHDLLPAVIDL